MKIIWLGHSGFRIEIEDVVLLIDPWLDGNPSFPQDRRAEALQGATHILLTHGHGDHASSAIEIAKETGASLVGIHELAKWFSANGAEKVIGFNKGGTIACGKVKVTMVNASHSASIDFTGQGLSPAGSPAGYMIAGEGQVIYFSGDTDIMADMEWMAHYHKPTIGILSCGGLYTMDMERAAYAARRYFQFKVVIPCHYKTFPALAQDASVLRAGLPTDVSLHAPAVMEAVTLNPQTLP